MGRRRDHGQCPAEALLHLRRLDAFLKHHGLHHTAHTLEIEAGVLFEAAHLQQLVRQELWAAAHRYLRSFSALWQGEGATTQYTALLDSLAHHSILAWYACRGEEGGRAAALLHPAGDALRNAHPEVAQRKAIYCSMASQQARASVNWEEIKLRTLESVQELLHLRPDLARMSSNRLPRHTPTPRDIVPLGLRGCRRHRRKRVSHQPARNLAHFLLHKRLPFSHEINHSGESGVKRPGCEDDCYTQNGQHNFDSGKDTEKPRTAGEFDEQSKEKDFSGTNSLYQ